MSTLGDSVFPSFSPNSDVAASLFDLQSNSNTDYLDQTWFSAVLPDLLLSSGPVGEVLSPESHNSFVLSAAAYTSSIPTSELPPLYNKLSAITAPNVETDPEDYNHEVQQIDSSDTDSQTGPTTLSSSIDSHSSSGFSIPCTWPSRTKFFKRMSDYKCMTPFQISMPFSY